MTNFKELKQPSGIGVEVLDGFIDQKTIDEVVKELNTSKHAQWYDAHEVYENKRGLTITQNHYTIAFKLNHGSQAFRNTMPNILNLKEHISKYITQDLSNIFPILSNWEADELSFHLYDNQNVGLSKHKDNLRFIGLIAIASLDGESDFVINHNNKEINLKVKAGDLCLLRGSDLIKAEKDIRPEHSVVNLKTKTRTSMMLRANNKPNEAIPGFKFNNWK